MHNVEKGRMIVETKMYTLIMSCGRGTHVLVGSDPLMTNPISVQHL